MAVSVNTALFILHTFTTSILISLTCANFCYYGKDVNSIKALQNQSCLTGEVHLLKTLYVTDYSEKSQTEDPVDKQSANLKQAANNGSKNCFVFRHISTNVLQDNVKQESVHTQYGCDFKNVCRDVLHDDIIVNVTMNGSLGQLFCCSSDNCNNISKIPHLPAENRVCYEGYSNNTGSQVAKMKSCSRPDALCAKKTMFTDGKEVMQHYFCDQDKLCEEQLASGAFRSCHGRVLESNMTEELCCCDGNICFKPPWVSASEELGDGSLNNTYSDWYMNHPIHKPSGRRQSGLVISGIIAALVMIISFGIGAVVVVVCKRRQPSRDPNVIMQYERLSNSEPDGIEAVIL
ncbi:uncharacterized protein LOC101855810 [Aplysia californica]|uniref:Uncharacterized protein LOC101855810 n=1 Tax=Aplysia californica TaxID=6500 RepID=A0ABM0JX84_APLCA|nr:uncharacterized protein LOC101855810 [Aplysia californica]